MINRYSDFYPFMVDDLPGCPTIEKLQKLRQAFREFAMETESWTEELAKVNLVADQTTYDLNPTYDGLVKRIVWVKISGSAQSTSHYELRNERQLYWKSDYVPSTSVTSGLQVKVALYPDVGSRVVDPNFFTRWFEAILAKAKCDLMSMEGKKWYNPRECEKYFAIYRKRYASAIKERYVENKTGSLMVNLSGLTGKAGSFA